MGSVYPRNFRAKGGKIVRSKTYWISYKDEHGKVRTVKGFRDKKASLEKLRQLEERAARIAVGLPVAQQGPATQAVAETIRAYLADQQRQGKSAAYRKRIGQQLADVFAWCGWKDVAAVRSDRLTEFLSHLDTIGLARKGKGSPRARPCSACTCNHYRDALSIFLNWCVAQGWLQANPVERVPRASLGSPGDVSRRPMARRALVLGEFQSLTSCPKVRAWRRDLYLVAGLSGLRANELRQLEPCDFTLGASSAWHLRPEITKGKRLDRVPMLPECAETMARLAAGKRDGERIFAAAPNKKTMRLDFDRAGIARRDHRGRTANGHSLRYFFCTLIGRELPIQHVRTLMRHRDIRTTVGLYLDLGIEDVAEKLRALPPLFRQAAAGAKEWAG
jgi:integrase